jgi:predicted RNase H-like HicB family nuclease
LSRRYKEIGFGVFRREKYKEKEYIVMTEFTGGMTTKRRMTMIYWKGEEFWLGKLLEHPEIMTQGETLEELEENIKDAYLLMAMDEVPEEYQMKEIAI